MVPTKSELRDLGELSAWAPQLAETFVSLASDIALVLDSKGVITNVAQGSAEPLAPSAHEWVGRPWVDTVTGETRGKIDLLLAEVAATGLARRREINHFSSTGLDIPVAYTAIRLGEHGPVLAVGRDLRSVAAIQRRFLDAQQDMERGYWRARQAESRYRLLFQVATDAVMVVDAQTLQILEANQAASELFDFSVEHLVGRPATFGFERHSRGAVDELLTTARASGRTSEIRARLAGKITPTSVAATPFRADDAMRLLVRVRTIDTPATSNDLNATLARLVDGASDGVVVTDSSARVLVANPAFLALVQAANEGEVKGRALMDWLGVTPEELGALVQQVRGQGIARRVESQLRSSGHAQTINVEISAALLTEGDQECIGFTIRATARQNKAPSSRSVQALQSAIAALAGAERGLALPDLLRQATALAERYFVEQACERSAGDLGAAAELLGITRASLTMRRRRQGRPPGSVA